MNKTEERKGYFVPPTESQNNPKFRYLQAKTGIYGGEENGDKALGARR
jgi:hypothetical protein